MLNKRGGWKKFQKLINGEVPIRAWRVEKVSKINKRASLFIRQVRVLLLLVFLVIIIIGVCVWNLENNNLTISKKSQEVDANFSGASE